MAKETFGIGMHGQDILRPQSLEIQLKRYSEKKTRSSTNGCMDAIFESPKAKKNLCRKRDRPSVDPSCFGSTIYNDFY